MTKCAVYLILDVWHLGALVLMVRQFSLILLVPPYATIADHPVDLVLRPVLAMAVLRDVRVLVVNRCAVPHLAVRRA